MKDLTLNFSFEKRNVYEDKTGNEGQQNARPDYSVRENIRVYELNPHVEPGCGDVSRSAELPILRTPTDIDFKDAWQFKGEKVNEMLLKNKPFAIAAPSVFGDFKPRQSSLCNRDRESHETCLLLITNPQGDTVTQNGSADHKYHISEIISIRKMKSTKLANPIWYMAIPFALPADLVLLTMWCLEFAAPFMMML